MSDFDDNSPAAMRRLNDPEALFRENESLRDRLEKLERQNVVEGKFQGEAPQYYINEPGVYLDDTHWPGGMTIDYIGTPNLSMVPMNDPAKRIMGEFIERLEAGARKVAARNGREYFGLVTDRNVLIGDAMEQAKRDATAPIPIIQVPQPTNDIPVMPHTPEAQAQIARRGRGRPAKVVASESPMAKQDLGAPRLNPAPTEGAIVGSMRMGR